MSKWHKQARDDDQAVDDALAHLTTLSVRETEKATGKKRWWLNELKHRFPKLHAAMRSQKTLRTDTRTPSESAASQKAGSAFLRRALKYSPENATRAESTSYTIIYGLYLIELRRRMRRGRFLNELSNVFHLGVRTAQRYRRLAHAFTKRNGIGQLCTDAVRANKPFPYNLFTRISTAVGNKSLRRLYAEHGIH